MTDDTSIPRVGAIPEEFWEDLFHRYPERMDGFCLKDIVLWHHLLKLWEDKAGPRLAEMDLKLIADRLWLGNKEIVECMERLREGALLVPVQAAIADHKGVPADLPVFMPVVPTWYDADGWRGDGTIRSDDNSL
jgi:hypothetical protein